MAWSAEARRRAGGSAGAPPWPSHRGEHGNGSGWRKDTIGHLGRPPLSGVAMPNRSGGLTLVGPDADRHILASAMMRHGTPVRPGPAEWVAAAIAATVPGLPLAANGYFPAAGCYTLRVEDGIQLMGNAEGGGLAAALPGGGAHRGSNDVDRH